MKQLWAIPLAAALSGVASDVAVAGQAKDDDAIAFITCASKSLSEVAHVESDRTKLRDIVLATCKNEDEAWTRSSLANMRKNGLRKENTELAAMQWRMMMVDPLLQGIIDLALKNASVNAGVDQPSAPRGEK